MWITRERVTAAVAVVSTSVGMAAGFALAHKKLEKKFDERLEQEIRQTKAFYQNIQKPASPMDVEIDISVDPTKVADTAIQDLQNAVRGLDYGAVQPSSEADHHQAVESIHHHNGDDQEDETVSVFSESAAYTDEMTEADRIERESREANELPYVISVDEFMAGDRDYEQVNLTYYEEDDVLSDDKDVPVPDSDMVAGDDNLTKFGFLSRDRNVVYVRNDRLQMDLEIVRSKNSYAKEVAGLTHEDRPGRGKVRKFRGLHE